MSLYGYKKKTKSALYMQHFAPRTNVVKRPTPRRPRQTRIRAVSKGKAADKRRYRARVKVWLTEAGNRECSAHEMIFPEQEIMPATQCHHVHGRGWNGELLMVEKMWMPVCADCHSWIHNNVDRARSFGLYAAEGKWNEMP